jgi:hypothetical protein
VSKAMNRKQSLLILLMLVSFAAGTALAQSKTLPPTAEQTFSNIKVLQGIPAAQVMPLMTTWNTALGVGCPYCHTAPNFASDDKPTKDITRQMYVMTQALNKASFNGQSTITCYSCHHGSAIPANGLAAHAGAGGPALFKLPTADDIVANYVSATGGADAIHRMTSRYILETRETDGRLPAQIEHFEKAPNLTLTTSNSPVGTIAQGFDGKTVWIENGPSNVTPAKGTAAARVKADSDFYEPFDLKKEYPGLQLVGLEKLAGHDVYHLDGFASSGSPVQLYFDVKTGLLLRKVTSAWLKLGEGTITMEYDDYRAVGGIKFPFLVREIGPKPSQVVEIQRNELKVNVPIDATKFTMPAPAKPSSSWTNPTNH